MGKQVRIEGSKKNWGLELFLEGHPGESYGSLQVLAMIGLVPGASGTLRFDPDSAPEVGAVEELLATIECCKQCCLEEEDCGCGDRDVWRRALAAARAELAGRGKRVVETRYIPGRTGPFIAVDDPGRYTLTGPLPEAEEADDAES